MNSEQARTLVSEEVLAIYRRLQQGNDVSPGQRLRLEGKVELLLQMGLLEWAWLQDFITQQYQGHFSQPLAEGYWQWLEEEKRFCLPCKMQDAPVYKG